MGEQVVEIARLLADQMREYLALMPAWQIGAGRGRRQVELRAVTRMLGHRVSSGSEATAGEQHRAAEAEGQSVYPDRANSFVRVSIGPGCLRYLSTDRAVDNYGSQNEIVQQPPAAV